MADKVIAKGAGAKSAISQEEKDVSRPAENEADEAVEDEDDEDYDQVDAPTEAGAETSTTSTKPKKKRKPKKKKKLVTEDGEAKNISTTVAQSPSSSKDIQNILQQLALAQSGGASREGKPQEEYKFWNTQPVPKFKEPNLLQTTNGGSLPEGPILPDEVCKAAARAEPEKLVDGFEWDLLDLETDDGMQELYDLLYNHYVEDAEGTFRFNYSIEFLNWALKPPGWKREWHIGVRTKAVADGKKGKLVAFISGVPVTLKIRQKVVKATEINFLTVHHKLRSKRLAPVLIKEVTRQCYRNGIYQALYTAGTLLPTPVTTCRYFHRSLDWSHLYKNGFSHLPQRSTEAMQVRKYFLPSKTGTKGLRLMKVEDVSGVKALLIKYLDRFHLKQEFSDEELTHLLCSDASKGVVWPYVVEQDGEITDLVSYYLLESTVLKATSKSTIRAAYLYYYATTAAFSPNASTTLQPRLSSLINDALILAKKDNFHVFNALTLLDNPLFLKEQKFEPGDGKLHYYLFNWRTPPLGGGVDEKNEVDASKMGGVGVVML
ncbi:glycylpeptide N-tetradecanoyltransferase [Oleoguttula sp. CCFEE 5521]